MKANSWFELPVNRLYRDRFRRAAGRCSSVAWASDPVAVPGVTGSFRFDMGDGKGNRSRHLRIVSPAQQTRPHAAAPDLPRQDVPRNAAPNAGPHPIRPCANFAAEDIALYGDPASLEKAARGIPPPALNHLSGYGMTSGNCGA